MTKPLTKNQKRFNDYLIKLSKNNIYENCINEWFFIYNLSNEQYDNNCLCGKLLKHQYYYCNIETKKVICVGKSCRQELEKIEKKTLTKKEQFLKKFFETNGIENIGDFDLVIYCQNNIIILINEFISEIQTINNLCKLSEYEAYVKEFDNLFDISDILENIEIKKKFIIEREKKEKEEKEKMKLEEEQRIQKMKLEEEQRIRKMKLEEEQKNKKLELMNEEKARMALEKRKKEEQEHNEKRINYAKNLTIIGKTNLTLQWLVNNSTLLQINQFLKENKITKTEYNEILIERNRHN